MASRRAQQFLAVGLVSGLCTVDFKQKRMKKGQLASQAKSSKLSAQSTGTVREGKGAIPACANSQRETQSPAHLEHTIFGQLS